MPGKPVVLRAGAKQDVDEALTYLLGEAGRDVALASVDALEQATAHLARNPLSGSPRYGHELDLAGLRAWPVGRFPYLIFYIDGPDHLDVWRVLHAHRDIPEWLQE